MVAMKAGGAKHSTKTAAGPNFPTKKPASASASSKAARNKEEPRIYKMSVARLYPLYVAKAVKKGRTKAEVDKVVSWLTGFTGKQLQVHLNKGTDMKTFITKAHMNPKRALIKGKVCGVQVEEVKDKIMREIRYLDKLIEELVQGKAMENILRK
mmetsp:Transcript_16410/g.28359  ORF Transcript_16410/g.28359 Transcript_16410/m.28359 type:complete len:154 (-) Transcript_16410:5-466(-)